MNRLISKEDMQIANKHMKRYLILLLIRDMKIKTMMSYYLILIGIAKIKKESSNNYW